MPTFLNTFALWGLAGVAVPIIIYLLFRQRYRRVPWAAMAFLLAAMKRNRRRLRVENLLLLLVRTALVALFVLGLARPVLTLPSTIGGETLPTRNVLILVDTSAGMGYRVAGRSVFERARQAATELYGRLGPGDRVALAAADEDVRALVDVGFAEEERVRKQVAGALEEIEVSSLPSDVPRVLARLLPILDTFDRKGTDPEAVVREPKTIYFVTDLARVGWLGAGEEPDPTLVASARTLAERRARLELVDVGDPEPRNVAVASIRVGRGVIGVLATVRLDVEVVSHSHREERDLVLTPVVDGRPGEVRRIDLAPDEKRIESFHLTFADPGAHAVSVRLETDGLEVDNERGLAVDVRDRVDVLLVDGEDDPAPWEAETDFLAVALAPVAGEGPGADLIRPEVVGEAAMTDALRGSAVVFLANVAVPAPQDVTALEDFVEGGGGLVVYLGDRTERDPWNDRAWKGGEGLLPARLVAPVGDPDRKQATGVEVRSPEHPVLRFFKPDRYRAVLAGARVYRYWAVAADHDAEVLLGYTDGTNAPAMVVGRYGRGRVALVTTSADTEWNDLAVDWPFLVLNQDLVHHLAGGDPGRKNLIVGEPYESLVSSADYAREIDLVTPQRERMPKRLVEVAGQKNRFLLSHRDTQVPGLYEIIFRGTTTGDEERRDWFAVNVDPGESDLEAIGVGGLRALLAPLEVGLHAGAEVAAGGGGTGEGEFWTWCIGAALFLLCLESLLAWSFGRRYGG